MFWGVSTLVVYKIKTICIYNCYFVGPNTMNITGIVFFWHSYIVWYGLVVWVFVCVVMFMNRCVCPSL